MSPINWTAVVTAVAILLVVDYFARPLLDARKERILDQLRARRELDIAIKKLSISAGKVRLALPKDADPKLKELWRQETARHYDLMKTEALKLSDDLDRYASAHCDAISDLVIKYAYCVHGVVISLRTRDRQAEIIEGLGIPMAKTIRRPVPWWRPDHWTSARDELLSKIKDTEQPPELDQR